MRKHYTRRVRMTLSAAVLAVGLAGMGCEKPSSVADRQVQSAMAESDQAADKAILSKGDPNKAALPLLTKAAADPAASKAMQAVAKERLAQTHMAIGTAKVPELSKLEAAAAQALNDMEFLATTIGASNSAVAQLSRSNPAAATAPEGPIIKGFEKNKADADAAVAKQDEAIGKLQTQITAAETEIKDLQTKIADARSQAATLGEKSKQAKGEESVKLFKQAREAEALAAKIEAGVPGPDQKNLRKAQDELAGLQALLAEGQGQREIFIKARDAAAEQIKQLQADWQATQQAIGTRSDACKKIAADPNIAKLALDLQEAMGKAATLRKAIDADFDAAIKAHDAALKAANEVEREVTQQLRDEPNRESPARYAWGQLLRAHSPNSYKLAKARALLARGAMYASLKSLMDSQKHVTDFLSPLYAQAKLEMPAGLVSATFQADLDSAKLRAMTDLNDADGLVAPILEISTANPDKGVEKDKGAEKTEAASLRMAIQHTLFCLNGSDAHLTNARSALGILRDSVKVFGATEADRLGALPTELETGVVQRPVVVATPRPTPVVPTPAEATVPAAKPAVPDSPSPAPAVVGNPPPPPAGNAPGGRGGLGAWGKLLGKATSGGGPASQPADLNK